MKIKINATPSELGLEGLSKSEARRLSYATVETTVGLDGRDTVYWVESKQDNNDKPWYISKRLCKLADALDLTKPVQTRDGRPVEIKFVDERIGDEPVIGIIDNNRLGSWSKDGRWSIMDEHEDDLVNVPPPVTVVETAQVRDTIEAQIFSDGSVRIRNNQTTGGFTLSADEMRKLIERYESNVI